MLLMYLKSRTDDNKNECTIENLIESEFRRHIPQDSIDLCIVGQLSSFYDIN